MQRGDEVKPARPGNLGIAEGTSFGGLGGAGSVVAGAGVAMLGDGGGGMLCGCDTSGAEVKPQGFLGSFSGSVWTSRAGAAEARGEVVNGSGGKWHSGADVKPAAGGGGGGATTVSVTGTSGICSCTAHLLALVLRNRTSQASKQGGLVSRHLPEPLLLDAEGECNGLKQ